MSSIDERIVELQFDNGQFEAGVATSLGTLDKLKKGLNLEASAKSLNGLNAAGRSFSLANVANNVQTVANRFSALGIIGDQVLRRITDKAIGMGKSLVTAIPNQIVTGGKKRAQNIEQAKFQLEGLGVAWDDVYDSIDKAVKGTAYGMDEAAKVASQYVATGVKLGDEMTNALTAISGVAAMTNSTYEDTGRIFTTVAGQGRLMGDQLNQLAARGLNVAATLTKFGKYTGKTEEEIRKLVSKGQISFKDFSDAMYEAFGEHAKDAENTFNGALSNVKASLSRMGAQFATPAYEEVRKVLIAVKQVFKTVEELIKPISAKFTEIIQDLSKRAVDFLGVVNTFLEGFIGWEDRIKNISNPLSGIIGNFFKAQTQAKKLAKYTPATQKSLDESVSAMAIIASKSKLSYKEVGDIFKRVADQGRLTSDELGKLERNGVRATAALAQSLGKTESQISLMTSKGMIGFQTFSDAMNEAFGMNATGTISIEQQSTRVQKLMDIVHNGLKDTKLYGQITQGMGKVTEFLGLNLDLNASLGESIEDSEELVTIANKVIDGLYGNGEERKKLLTEEYGGWALIQNKVNELLGCEKRHEVTQEELEKFTKGNAAANKEANAELKKQNEKLKLAETILNGLTATSNGLIGVFNILKSAGMALWNNIIAPFVQWAVPRIVAGVLSITGALGNKLLALETKLSKSDFFNKKTKEIADFFIKTKDSAVAFGKKVASLPGVQKLGASLKRLAASAKELGGKGLTAITSFFSKLAGKGINFDKLLPIIDGLSTKLSNLADTISTKMQNLPTVLGSLFEKFGQDFPEIKTWAQGIVDSIYNTILNWSQGKISLGDIFSNIDLGQTVDSIIAKIETLKKKIEEFIEFIRTGGQSGSDTETTPVVAGIEQNFEELEKQSFNFDEIVKNFQEGFANFNFETLFKGVKVGSLAYMVVQIGGFFKQLQGVAENIGKVPESISGVFDAMSDTIGTYQKSIKADILLKIAGAIAILAGSLWVMAQIPQEQLMSCVQVLGALGAGLIAMYGVFSMIHDKWPGGSGGGKEAGLLDPIAKSLNGFLKAAKHALNALVLAELGVGLMLIAQGMLAIVAAFKIIAAMDLSSITKNFGNFMALFIMLGVLAGIARIAGGHAVSFGAAMILISISLGIMALVVKKIMDMGLISRDGRKALEMMEEFLVTLAIVVGLGSLIAGKNAAKFGASMLLVSVAIAILTGAIIALTKIKPEDLKNATIALDSIMIVFALLGVALGKASSLKFTTGIVIGLLVAELVGALYYLTTIPAEELKASVLALDSMLAVLALTLGKLSKINDIKGAFAGVAAIALIMAAMVGALWAIKKLDVGQSIENVNKLRGLLIGVAIAVRILQGTTWSTGAKAAVSFISFIGIVGAAVLALTLVCAKVNESAPGFQSFLESGIPLLESIGSAIGGFLGNLAGGFVGGLATGALPVIAQNLSDFGTNLGNFCDNIGKFDKTALDGALNASQAIIALADAQGGVNHLGSFGPFNLITGKENEGGLEGLVTMLPDLIRVGEGVAKFSAAMTDVETDKMLAVADVIEAIIEAVQVVPTYTNGELSSFAGELEAFADPFVSFATRVAGVSLDSVGPAIEAIAEMVKVADAIPNDGGALGVLVGNNSLSEFGNQMRLFATSLVSFSATIGNTKFENVKTAAKAAAEMVKVADAIPNDGGALGILVGNNSLSEFGNQMRLFATSLVSFTATIGNTKFDNVSSAAKAAAEMVKVADAIPNSGGVLAKLVGDNTLSQYGAQMYEFGKSLAKYALSVKYVNADDIRNSADAVTSLKTVLEGLDLGNAGGVFEIFAKSDLSKIKDFGESMGNLGTGVKALEAANVGEVGKAIQQLVDDMKGITDLTLYSGSTDGLNGALINLAENGLASFKQKFDDDIPNVKNTLSNYIDSAVSGIDGKRIAVILAGGRLISALKQILSAGAIQMKEPGETAGGMFAVGVAFKHSAASSAGRSLGNAAKGGAGDVSLYSTGQNVGQGYVNGIKSKIDSARKAGYALGKAGANGTAEGAQTKSPSRLTMKIGGYVGEGLVVGMMNTTRSVVSAGQSLGRSAATSLKNPLSVVTDILGADFDVDPTIRPVLDLSDVQNGARSIGGILSGYSVNAGLINASMNGRVNVSNADVVAAIGDLSTKFDNLPTGDSITIGGITYDDGTGIADAVRQLAAAARVQRRA